MYRTHAYSFRQSKVNAVPCNSSLLQRIAIRYQPKIQKNIIEPPNLVRAYQSFSQIPVFSEVQGEISDSSRENVSISHLAPARVVQRMEKKEEFNWNEVDPKPGKRVDRTEKAWKLMEGAPKYKKKDEQGAPLYSLVQQTKPIKVLIISDTPPSVVEGTKRKNRKTLSAEFQDKDYEVTPTYYPEDELTGVKSTMPENWTAADWHKEGEGGLPTETFDLILARHLICFCGLETDDRKPQTCGAIPLSDQEKGKAILQTVATRLDISQSKAKAYLTVPLVVKEKRKIPMETEAQYWLEVMKAFNKEAKEWVAIPMETREKVFFGIKIRRNKKHASQEAFLGNLDF